MAPLYAFQLAISLNSEPVKYAILAVTAPMWVPFFKALWHTLNDGLREEGGLLGHPPTEEQLAEMERELGPAAASLVSVPKEGPIGAGGQPQPVRGGGQQAPAPASGAQKPAGGRRTFR